MPQFDIFGNYILAFFFVFLYYVYYFSFVIFFDSISKLFYLHISVDMHVFLCDTCKNLNIVNFNKFRNCVVLNFIS